MGARPRLEDKVAIVTGAGSIAPGIGNGRAAAVLFAREGARVLLVDQNSTAAEETREMIRKEGGTAEIFAGDVTRADDCRASVEKALTLWGNWTSSTITWASVGAAAWWKWRKGSGNGS